MTLSPPLAGGDKGEGEIRSFFHPHFCLPAGRRQGGGAVGSIYQVSLYLGACLREAASAKAGERGSIGGLKYKEKEWRSQMKSKKKRKGSENFFN